MTKKHLKGRGQLKNKILILAVVLTFGCVVMVVLSGQKLSKSQQDLDKERYSRMVAEEKYSQTISKLNSAESEMNKKQNRIENVQALLEKEKTSADEIRGQMEKLLQVNKRLEDALKSVVPPEPPAPLGVSTEGQKP